MGTAEVGEHGGVRDNAKRGRELRIIPECLFELSEDRAFSDPSVDKLDRIGIMMCEDIVDRIFINAPRIIEIA